MKNLETKLTLFILAIIISGGVFIILKSPGKNPNPETAVLPNTASVIGALTESYFIADVASHRDATSCWTAISENVYDLTPWISKHPGGKEAILSICGIDGTKAFTAQHGGQAKPEAELRSFFIGKLK